ncbi:MAG: ABC transporter permease [Desulfurococcaceae archaeon]
MSFRELVLAEYKLVYGELFRRKSALVAIIMYPYLFTAFTLFIGFAGGSREIFIERTGVDPVIFMLTASYTVMSMLSSVDDVLWRPLNDMFIGTLPYVIASPVNRLKLYFAIPLPRLTVLLIMGFTSLIPVYTFYYGLHGLAMGLLVIGIIVLGCLVTIPLAIALAGLVHSIGESWRVLNIVRPLLMILLGAYYPRVYMPFAGYLLSYMIPPSHVIEALQRILSGIYTGTYVLLVISILTSLMYLPVSGHSLRHWERKKVIEGVKTS